jgi:hypothetical protein
VKCGVRGATCAVRAVRSARCGAEREVRCEVRCGYSPRRREHLAREMI